MTMISATLSPEAGRLVSSPSEWSEGEVLFSTTLSEGSQIEHSNSLTMGSGVSGPDGEYILRHIQPNGMIEAVTHIIDTVAPTLTSPSASAISHTTVTGSVVTDEANGVLYALVSPSAVELDSDIVMFGDTYPVDDVGTQEVSFGELSASETYHIHFLQEDSAGNQSGSVVSGAVTTPEQPIVEPPPPVKVKGTLSVVSGQSIATLEEGFSTYFFQKFPVGEPKVGWQLITTEGYFDNMGNYWLDEGQTGVSDAWIISTDGLIRYGVIDSEGLTLAEPDGSIATPAGVVTIFEPVVLDTEAEISFSYSEADQTGFQYRLNGGEWVDTAAPILLSNLSPETHHALEIAAYNSAGSGQIAQVTFTTLQEEVVVPIPPPPKIVRKFTLNGSLRQVIDNPKVRFVRGDRLRFLFTLSDNENEGVNLVTSETTLTFIVGGTGSITEYNNSWQTGDNKIDITSAETNQMPEGVYKYYMVIENGTDIVTVGQGTFRIVYRTVVTS